MVEQTDLSRPQAIETLLHAYLTGDPLRMDEILGTGRWAEVVEITQRGATQRARKATKKALQQTDGSGEP